MKRIIITGAALLAIVPASIGLIGNAAFSQSIPVRVPSQVTPVSSQITHVELGDDKGGLTAHLEPGDDKGGLTAHVEPGDDNGGLTAHVEPGDDNGGLTAHVEPGDDNGGLTTHVEPGDDKGGLTTHVEPGDDKGGHGHDDSVKAGSDDGSGHK